MIQYWLKDLVAAKFPGVKVTADYEPNVKTYITVFYEGGGEPGRYDIDFQFPRYMVWIESDDWGKAEWMAREIYKLLHDYPAQPVIEVEYFDKFNNLLGSENVKLFQLEVAGDINPLGVEEGSRRYSVNFDATITLLKEENTNG